MIAQTHIHIFDHKQSLICSPRMAYIAEAGYPGGLPEKFWNGESILPGHKFTAQNSNWAKSGRLKVTSASWLVMWKKGLATLKNNPEQAKDWGIWERLARQAAILVNGLDEVRSVTGRDAVSKLIDEWTSGSASLGNALESAINTQPEHWSMTHLNAFNEALIAAHDKTVADEAMLSKVDPGQSPMQALRIRQRELDEQVIEALLSTYKVEMTRIRRDLMSERDVHQTLLKKKEALGAERYNQSTKSAKHFLDHHIQIIEYGPEQKPGQIWMKLQAALMGAVPNQNSIKPRFLTLVNFRVPQMIGARNYDLGVSLTGLALNQASHLSYSSAAVILAPEYPKVGCRQADIDLVKALHDNMARISVSCST